MEAELARISGHSMTCYKCWDEDGILSDDMGDDAECITWASISFVEMLREQQDNDEDRLTSPRKAKT